MKAKPLDSKSRDQEAKELAPLYHEYAKFYEMSPDEDIREITTEVLNSPRTKEAQKQSIQNYKRRFFAFTYPSDGFKIKGIISFVPNPQKHPLLVLLRGGNRIFGIPNPGIDLMSPEQYTAIMTTYRGGVSEGEDQYGGDDVNDVKNLMDFIPEVERKLNTGLHNNKLYLLGWSRGAMMMFLSLARFPDLRVRFDKIVSLSGLLDMHQNIEDRPDMKEMFLSDFGLNANNEEEWVNHRDPVLSVAKTDLEMAILIIQGLQDNRVTLAEGYTMVAKLKSKGCNVTYWELPGDHCLRNVDDIVPKILQWLESEV